MNRKFILLGIACTSAAAVGAGNLQADAAQGTALVTFTASSPPAAGGRTLSLYNSQGQALTSVDLSHGSNGFQAVVTDTNYSQTGFNVTANMSNLYGFSNGAYNCSQEIPSSDVSLYSPTSLLDAYGLGASGVPSVTLSGNITSAITAAVPALSGLLSVNVTNLAVNTVSQTLTQSQLAGGATGQLIGSALSTANTSLPIKITGPATLPPGSAFTNPAADPPGANCNATAGSNPTPVAVESGSSNVTGLVSDTTAVANALGSPTTALTLANSGWINSSNVLSEIATTYGVPLGDLDATTGEPNAILAALTPSIPSIGSVQVNGNYSASPVLSVSAPSTASGSYQGQMTVTLTDTGS